MNGERLMRCGLTSLEKRRKRGHLIEACKIMTGKKAISAHKFFKISMESTTREHRYKMNKKQTWIQRNKFFSARVVNLCKAWIRRLLKWTWCKNSRQS